MRVREGCRAPTPHRSRAAEAGALSRRLTQVCGARARRKKALKIYKVLEAAKRCGLAIAHFDLAQKAL